MRLPGVAPQRVQTPVSQIALVPTLLDALGCAIPDHLPGRSLLPRLASKSPPPDAGEVDDAVVIEWAGVPPGGSVSGYRPPAADTPGAAQLIQAMAREQRTIRQGDWKLTVDEGGEHELYHLATDPGEQHNLLFAPRHPSLFPDARAAVRTLWAALQSWQRRTADPLPLPDPTVP
jgi:arylsulfatase A-like enzyme